MADNSLKTPLAATLNRLTEKKVTDGIQQIGKSLPCSVVSVDGAIVTVKFEIANTNFTLPQVTVPIIGSEYIRVPIQPGCKGVVRASDARLGGISGLGAGVADLSPPANLAALVFEPIGNSEWFAVDGQSLVMYGPNGVILMDMGNNTTLVITPTTMTLNSPDATSLVCGANSVSVTPAGVFIVGALSINGQPYIDHRHGGVDPGGGTSGGVV